MSESVGIAGVIGIRREDKNKWERRVPLTPDHVRQLIRGGMRVLVQPSNTRIFPNAAYVEAGAELAEDLSPAATILAVKEVPVHLLIPSRTYIFFSHTIKAQAYNMPLLDTLLAKRIRLIDYECITEGGVRGGRRLVAFGRFAGIAGMVDFLRGCGERFLSLGYSTPFLAVAAMYMYPDVAAAKNAVRACGEAIAKFGLPDELSPFTAVFTGDGNVSRGAQEVFSLLPVQWVDPTELRRIRQRGSRGPTHVLYAAVAREEHMVRRRRAPPSTATAVAPAVDDSNGPASPTRAPRSFVEPLVSPRYFAEPLSPLRPAASSPPQEEGARVGAGEDAAGLGLQPDAAFDKAHYKAHPNEYEPIFHANVVPYCSVLVNCMYWEPRFPRLLRVGQAQALQRAGRLPLLGVCDISCDWKGSVEFLREFTSIEAPFYVYDAAGDRVLHDLEAPGVLFHAVDHLPSECPRDASEHFGACLLPLLPALARADPAGRLGEPSAAAAASADGGGCGLTSEQQDLPAALRGAVICEHGELSSNFSYIAALRAANERAAAGRGLKMSRSESFITVDLVGHLFDSGLLGRVLDAVEDAPGCSASIVDVRLGRDRTTPTEVRLQLFAKAAPPGATASSGGGLSAVLRSINALAAPVGAAVKVNSSEPVSSAAAGAGAPGAATPAAATTTTTSSSPSSSSLAAAAVTVEPASSYEHESLASDARAVPRPLAAPAKRVLVLGAGLVAAPLVEYLLRRPATRCTLASAAPGEAAALAAGRARVQPVQLNVATDGGALAALVAQHDLVVSLVPAPFHAAVARLCVAHRRHLVTASYVSPEMQALHDEAAAAGVTLLNEAGLDPGMDHMSAMRLIDAAKEAGGVVTKFVSLCGGLPAPEAANNPLGYKFSWSPRGALAAMRNGARYRCDGADVAVPGPALLAVAAPARVNPAFALEVLPNRDARPYAARYGIAGPRLATMVRGTLRYRGFCAAVHALTAAGMLDDAPRPSVRGASARAWLAGLLGLLPAGDAAAAGADAAAAALSDEALVAAVAAAAEAAATALVAAHVAALEAAGAHAATSAARAASAVCSNVGLSADPARLAELRGVIEWAGLLRRDLVMPLRGADCGDGGLTTGAPAVEAAVAAEVAAGTYAPRPVTHVPLDTTVALLTARPEMAYAAGERDLALMQHEVEVDMGLEGGGLHRHTCTLIEYARAGSAGADSGSGDGRDHRGGTAMSRTVGLTAAIGAQLILDGRVPASVGVQCPTTREWYGPMLDALEGEGIAFRHTVTRVGGAASV